MKEVGIAGHKASLAAAVNLACQTANGGFFVDFITFFPFVCAADLENDRGLLMPRFRRAAFPIGRRYKYTFIRGPRSAIQEESWVL